MIVSHSGSMQVHDHVLRPLLDPIGSTRPAELAVAPDTIDRLAAGRIADGHIPTAA